MLQWGKIPETDDSGGGLLAQDGDGELACVLDALIGVVVMVDAHGYGGRFGRNLHGAVGRAPGGPSFVPGADHIDSVR